ncbi:hypothetical protein COO60DRAFT_1514973, partial [Scenedesmus sp. NREL 46B-D3]
MKVQVIASFMLAALVAVEAVRPLSQQPSTSPAQLKSEGHSSGGGRGAGGSLGGGGGVGGGGSFGPDDSWIGGGRKLQELNAAGAVEQANGGSYAAHNSRRTLSRSSTDPQDSVPAANTGDHSGTDPCRERLRMGPAAASMNSNGHSTAPAAPAAPNSLQERGSRYGGFGRGGGGGYGGGGSYGPGSYYYSPGSASSRFDFGSMWAGGARKLQGAPGGPITSPETIKAASQPAAPNSLQERGGFGRGGGGGYGGGGSYGPGSYYYSPGSASSRFDFGSMWAGGARKLQGELFMCKAACRSSCTTAA